MGVLPTHIPFKVRHCGTVSNPHFSSLCNAFPLCANIFLSVQIFSSLVQIFFFKVSLAFVLFEPEYADRQSLRLLLKASVHLRKRPMQWEMSDAKIILWHVPALNSPQWAVSSGKGYKSTSCWRWQILETSWGHSDNQTDGHQTQAIEKAVSEPLIVTFNTNINIAVGFRPRWKLCCNFCNMVGLHGPHGR